jgi:hypothetical protein
MWLPGLLSLWALSIVKYSEALDVWAGRYDSILRWKGGQTPARFDLLDGDSLSSSPR